MEEVHFDTWITGIGGSKINLRSVRSHDGREFYGEALHLSHWAIQRETYTICYTQITSLIAKPFALGVGIEHPQRFTIDKGYNTNRIRERKNLPAASL